MGQRKNQILLDRIAIVLKSIREERNLTQQEVFDDTNIHLGRIETSKANLSISTLVDLCNYLEIKPSEFFRRVESHE